MNNLENGVVLLWKSIFISKEIVFMRDNTFKAKVIQLDTNIILSIIDIESITPPLENFINKEFISICEGTSGNDLEMVKSEILLFLNH